MGAELNQPCTRTTVVGYLLFFCLSKPLRFVTLVSPPVPPLQSLLSTQRLYRRPRSAPSHVVQIAGLFLELCRSAIGQKSAVVGRNKVGMLRCNFKTVTLTTAQQQDKTQSMLSAYVAFAPPLDTLPLEGGVGRRAANRAGHDARRCSAGCCSSHGWRASSTCASKLCLYVYAKAATEARRPANKAIDADGIFESAAPLEDPVAAAYPNSL